MEKDGQYTFQPTGPPDAPITRLPERAFASLTTALWAEAAETRRSAAEYLGRRGDARAVAPLVEALESDGTGGVRRAVVTALGTVGHPSAIPALVAAVEDGDEAVREAAAEALIRIGAPAAPALIEALLGEPVSPASPSRPSAPRNYVGLAALLGQVGDTEAIAPLVECLNTEDRSLNLAAARGLGILASRCPVPELRSVLPGLRRLARQGWEATHFRQVIRWIEAATAPVKDLPVPAAPGGQANEDLPVPVHAAEAEEEVAKGRCRGHWPWASRPLGR